MVFKTRFVKRNIVLLLKKYTNLFETTIVLIYYISRRVHRHFHVWMLEYIIFILYKCACTSLEKKKICSRG